MDAARTSPRLYKNRCGVCPLLCRTDGELKKEIVNVYGQGRNVILLLDDAQLLTRQGMVMIQELYNFDFDEKAVTVIAFGQNEVEDNFRNYPAINCAHLHCPDPDAYLTRNRPADGSIPAASSGAFPTALHR